MLKSSYFICFLFNYFVSGYAERPSVIIVGGGAAGIAAATKLLENSFTNITILEAENRIGGRIHSVKFGDGVVNLGAEYCFGMKGNIVYELAKKYNILEPAVTTLEDNVYYSDGSKLGSLITRDLDALLGEVYLKKYGNNSTIGTSGGDVVIERYNSTILPKYENDSSKIQILREGFRFCDGYVTLYDAVRFWFDVSADSDFEGADEMLVWKNIGYRIIIDILIRSYPDPRKKLDIDGKIHLNKSVQKIIWDADQTVTVLTADNSSYSSDYVILTQSVGVLKEQKDTLFDPKLPLSKERAIVDSGYGSIGRIVLKFSTKWWRDDEQLFSFFWSDKDWGTINSSDGPTKNGLSWIVQIREMMKLPGISNVWAIWISGDFLSEIETLPDNILKSGIQYVLNKFLGKTHNVTEIRDILKTTWTTNENFRGTSSYLKTGKYKSDDPVQRRLARPVRNSEGKLKLLFAGEATHSTLYTTVQGAIESGYREAERIIKLCNKSEQ